MSGWVGKTKDGYAGTRGGRMDRTPFYSNRPKRVRSSQELIEELKSFDDPSYQIRLRGQPYVRYGLVPTIARPHAFGGKTLSNGFDPKQEHDLLHRFRRHTYSHSGRILTKWEALFLARHHGLPVRLLDCTANPLVALYWACESMKDFSVDGAVFAFKPRANRLFLDVLDPESDPEMISGVRMVNPFYPTARMTAQAGL